MTDVNPEVEAVLRALDVPEDVAQRHLARLEAARVSGENVVPLRRPRRRTLRAGIGGTILAATLISGAGVAAASSSQPGDVLYGLKTARERIQLSMARDGDSRAALELKLARTRLGEAATLLREGETDLAIETLARADAALASAGAHGGAAIDEEVAGELDHRVEVLGGLLDGGLPDNAADAAREALERAISRGGRIRPAEGDEPGNSGTAPGRTDNPQPTPAGDRTASRPRTRTARPSRSRSVPTTRPASRPRSRAGLTSRPRPASPRRPSRTSSSAAARAGPPRGQHLQLLHRAAPRTASPPSG